MFQGYTPENSHHGTSKSPNWKGKSSEPNLHDFGFKILFSRGTLPKCFTWTKKWWFPKPNLLFKGAILRWTILNFETTSLPLKISHPKRKGSPSNHPFSGAFAVSFWEGSYCWKSLPSNDPSWRAAYTWKPQSQVLTKRLSHRCSHWVLRVDLEVVWGFGGPKRWAEMNKTYGIEFIDVKRLQEWSIYVYQ